MVQAILEGRKTQTRRIIKASLDDRGLRWANPITGWEDWHGNPVKCPYGDIGDVLWVRENYQVVGWDTKEGILTYKYADGKSITVDSELEDHIQERMITKAELKPNSWIPSIHMPKEACRLFLRITDRRVERLQDISKADAEAEGAPSVVPLYGWANPMKLGGKRVQIGTKHVTPQEGFSVLWQNINGLDSWNNNPWVWVVCFERINKPDTV